MKRILIVVSAILLIISCTEKEKICVITGVVFDSPQGKNLFLMKAVGGNYSHRSRVKIPIINNKFSYEFTFTDSEAYILDSDANSSQGAMVPIRFFPTNGKVKMELHSMDDFSQNRIEGGGDNKKHRRYLNLKESKFNTSVTSVSDSLNKLWDSGNYYTDTMKILQIELRATNDTETKALIRSKMMELRKSGNDLTLLAKSLKSQENEINMEIYNWQLDYLSKNNSIVSYYLLSDVLDRAPHQINLVLAENCYRKLSIKYPNHPYSNSIRNLLESIKNVRIGGYIDFSAPDLNGEIIKLSEVINGKIALVDLWSTWCGSCIIFSRKLIPVYDEFKDVGFTVVGVVADNDKERIEKRVEKENHPWKTLVELNNQNKIWEKYGISGNGGSHFLIDKDGSILAIHPTAKEIKKILKEKLN